MTSDEMTEGSARRPGPDGRSRLQVLGCRGSMPVSGPEFREYGGATTSYLIEAGGEAILVDAGTGILRADAERIGDRPVSLLLTHPHLDHIQGLPFFPLLFDPDRTIDLYGAVRGGRDLETQLNRVFCPPYWPVRLGDLPATVRFHALAYGGDPGSDGSHPPEGRVDTGSLTIGEVRVWYLEVPHPGGCTAFRLEWGERSLVVATDAELPALGQETPFQEAFLSFLADADLAVLDGQYTDREAERSVGYGHSTPRRELQWADAAHVRSVLITHHAPAHTDRMLRAMEDELRHGGAAFAREGTVREI